MIADSVLRAIGSTPIVRLKRLATPAGADVIVKLEYYNPTGSYKDRMALAMIEGAEARRALKPGMRVVEFTGGSTGSSLAMVCAVKGYPFTPVSSDAFSKEKLDTMRAFGAEPIIVASDGGKIAPGLFDRMRAEVKRLCEDPNVFWTDQFHNADAIGGYMGIGRELLGAHRVEGIAPGFIPPHLTRDVYDDARAIDEGEARTTARRLAREEGIFTGTSSALNVTAAIQIAKELGPGKTVATVAVDTGLKYLAGDLFVDI